jgi:hypothetical protein
LKENIKMETMESTEVEKPPRRTGLVIALGLLALLLIAAAVVGGRLLAKNQAAETGPEPPGIAFAGGVLAEGEGINLDDIQPAPELPERQADVFGLFVSQSDDTLVIGTGNTMVFMSSEGGSPETSYDGPAVEVLVTNQTQLYEDITEISFDTDASNIQEQVQLVESLGDLEDGTMVRVWGQQRGDRLIAEIVVYRDELGG